MIQDPPRYHPTSRRHYSFIRHALFAPFRGDTALSNFPNQIGISEGGSGGVFNRIRPTVFQPVDSLSLRSGIRLLVSVIAYWEYRYLWDFCQESRKKEL